MYLYIAVIHLIVFTIGAEVQHVCQSTRLLITSYSTASTTTRRLGSANFKTFNIDLSYKSLFYGSIETIIDRGWNKIQTYPLQHREVMNT